MAQPKVISYSAALDGIKQVKYWPPQLVKISWVQESKKKWPHSYYSRVGLLVDGAFPEGVRVELFYKESVIAGVPNTTYINFVYLGAVVFAIHDGGAARHVNRVGKGMKFYHEMIGHPHKHIPVPEASYGYAEPIERLPIDEFWYLFKQEANIMGDVKFNYPEDPQGRLL